MELEVQAPKAGGRVHALIGNHEYMTMMGDLRYVSDGELAAFGEGPRVTPVGRETLASYPKVPRGVRQVGQITAPGSDAQRHRQSERHAVSARRYQPALRQSQPGRAQRRDPRRATRRARWASGVGADPEGPLWFRGLAESLPPATLESYLGQLFAAQSARRIVMGHTIQENGISLRAGDRLALIDVGMSRQTINGAPSCLVIGPAAA